MRTIATGLQFPEGPIAMPDGSVLLVEIRRGSLTLVAPDGRPEVVAQLGGGPNGAAIGPDGACYVCNNGGLHWRELGGLTIPGEGPHHYSGGRIERVDLKSGKVDVLYTHCDGQPLMGPNDLVFDKQGGFWFTDFGRIEGRVRHRSGLYYAKADGSMIKEVVFPLQSANGVGLSPDERTVYIADTYSARLMAFDVSAPGEIIPSGSPVGAARYVASAPGHCYFDSLAVDSLGHVSVATLINGCITTFAPDGQLVRQIPLDDIAPTNLCFGGADRKTAFITLSSTGRLVALDWPVSGLALNFEPRGLGH
jgi:gluconolactonase